MKAKANPGGNKASLTPADRQRRSVSNGVKLTSIGQTARLAEVSTQSLQYYIMVGLVKPTIVTKTNRRLFDEKAVDRIKLIKKLNKSGYPLREIRELFLQDR